MQTRRILALDQKVINRIAAGEIITSPSNVVKELLENSIDANSTRIQVTLERGGYTSISIQDDGCGISREDLPIACRRHTTSKLKDFAGLANIATFGFRGEALYSISCVSHLKIVTKTEFDEYASVAEYADGELAGEIGAQAGNLGTIIEARNLFYNYPLRLKSVKPNAEARVISDIVAKYAVIHPNIAFVVVCDRKETVRTYGNSTNEGVLHLVYGVDLERSCIRMNFGLPGKVFVMMFMNSPYQKGSKRVSALFINGRLVENDALKKGIEEVYGNLALTFSFVMLSMPQQNIDVNIHPAKKIVKFLGEKEIVETICEKLSAALKEKEVQGPTLLTKPHKKVQAPLSNNQTTITSFAEASAAKKPDAADVCDVESAKIDENPSEGAASIADQEPGKPMPRVAIEHVYTRDEPEYELEVEPLTPELMKLPTQAAHTDVKRPAPENVPTPAKPMDTGSVDASETESREAKSPILRTQNIAEEAGATKISTSGPKNEVESDALTHPSQKTVISQAPSSVVTPEAKTQTKIGFDFSSKTFQANISRPPAPEQQDEITALPDVSKNLIADVPVTRTKQRSPSKATAAKKIDVFSELKFEPSKLKKPKPSSNHTIETLFENDELVVREVKLDSILSLRQFVAEHVDNDLCKIFHEMRFSGFLGTEAMVFTHSSSIYVLSVFGVLKDYFYQRFLELFANFLPMKVDISIDSCFPDSPEEATLVSDTITNHSKLLSDYFSINFDKGRITTLPIVLKGYKPAFAAMPLFLRNISTLVDWEEEIACFSGLIDQLSSLYSMPETDSSTQFHKDLTLIIQSLQTDAYKPSVFLRSDESIRAIPV